MGLTTVKRLLAATMPPPARARRLAGADGRSIPTPAPATVLRHCRCMDCLFWRAAPFSECRHGIIRNGIADPQYPSDAWHYCALYHGPQIKRDVWAYPKKASDPLYSRPSSPPVIESRAGLQDTADFPLDRPRTHS